ncbi:uncharacterized protein C6orf118-like isoform X1 [Etheostoma cragini]|uniref:uncharacterized protein C6orf118-like isoform X1 n=1 Tax=Etheostoma cragini TaxID=417921 RepID=UPI00155DF2A4|nr:uncharacterized protein C6orf118-like isoform X1 [Etheostoma cragini]XP_034753406.1 uncharacterized protein C6orf118-like isoform X1 [Etheostoma cragini]
MSNSSKPKPRCFRSDIQRLLLAAEAGQKDDILTYSSGHLGPRCLNQSQPHRETKQSFWSMSQSLKETPNTVKPQLTRAKVLVYVKKKEMKECPPKFSTGTALVESEVLKSRQDKASHCSSHADRREDVSLPKIVYSSSNSLPVQPRAFPQKKSKYLSDLEGKQHFDQEGLNNDGQLKKKKQFGRKVITKQDLWAGIHVAEMHERKLQKELSRLSVHSWPSRDRLAVFSDVFDDVCEGSPVFGRILREIKTDYDLYVNHLMASQSPLHDTSLDTSLKDLGNGKVRQMELEDAEKEVFRLEQEAKTALEENKRVRNESQNVPAIIGPEDSDMKNPYVSGLQDSCTNNLQSKRIQVLNTWREIQQLEEEIKEKLVSSVTTTATAGHIKDLKKEIMRLIASNDCLETMNKDLENNINMVVDREKASKAIRRMLWDKINCDLQTESE